MLKRLFSFMFRTHDEPVEVLNNENKPRSAFSTHDDGDMDDDPLDSKPRRARIFDAAMDRLSAMIPRPIQTGTAMDSSEDGGAHLKQAYAYSQPNISEALMMWYVNQGFIGYQMCAFIAQHWLVNKACAMPARDAIRQGYKVVSSDEKELPLEVLQTVKQYNDAFRLDGNMVEFIRLGRIFGVRILFFKVESQDPDYYEKPFNIDGITPGSYKGIVQVDPYWTAPMLDLDSSSNPESMHFYEPTWWMINGKRYHRTHLIIFRNDEVPDILKPSYIYGGVPVPQQIMERIYAAERTANEGPLLAMTKRTTVYSTNIAAAFSNKAKFDTKMEQWVAMRDNQQIKIADKDADTVQQFDTSLADLDAVIMTQYQLVAAIAKVPATKLLGTSPKGFGASGDYEITSYHEDLESIQTHDLMPLILRHLQLVNRSYLRPKLKIDFSLSVDWNPLDSPTASEEADINLKKAQADQAWIDAGSIDGVDVRNRLIADVKSGYTGIAPAMRPLNNEPDNQDDENGSREDPTTAE